MEASGEKQTVDGFRRRLAEEALARHLFGPHQRVLVALSGGPDSSALLDALAAVREIWPLRLHALYVDHGLRPQAPEEARFCAELAAARRVPLEVRRVDVPSLASRPGWSVESAGRHLRLRALEEEALRLGAERVALGHQADDRVETVLMRLLRGSGRRGLAAMAWVRPPFVRPLLAFRREETRAYCQAAGIRPREDASNADPAFFRNRLRLRLLPEMERYAPGLRRRLWNLAELLTDEEAWLDELTRALLPEVRLPDGSLDRRRFRHLPPAAQRRLLRLLAGSPPRQLDFLRVEAARRAVLRGRGREELGAGWVLAAGGRSARLRRRDGAAPAGRERSPEQGVTTPPEATAWTLPLSAVLLWRGADGRYWRFRLEGPAPRPGEPGAHWQPLWLDGRRLTEGGLAVRPARPGDRWQPSGLGLPVRLDRALRRRLAPASRARWPVLLYRGRPVWSPGLLPDARILAPSGAMGWALRIEGPVAQL
ncbi:MAG: tRNA lysidine(34) synthetase TilS [Bacillota bacterium]|nr:tRNA lysidine(34) synthetase TilS [Bacillota bacterium]